MFWNIVGVSHSHKTFLELAPADYILEQYCWDFVDSKLDVFRIYFMQFEENISLASFTTFKIGGNARFFVRVKNEEELIEAISFAENKRLPFFMLGGGSNLLVSDSGYSGLVIKNEIGGINFEDSDGKVFVWAGSGVVWDALVEETVRRGLYGLENLSAIPGTVGAAPVQNIGAYGGEVRNSIRFVRIYEVEKKEIRLLSKEDCQFGYRDSIFKHEGGRRFVIVSVCFELEKNGVLHTDYKDLKNYFESKKITDPTLRDVREAIVSIRKSKMPDWSKVGTAGSFFKNPVVTPTDFEKLKKTYPELPAFDDPHGVKISAAWILDKVCGFRGYRLGAVGVHENQALVLVNYGGGSAEDVKKLALEMQKKVKERTGVSIDNEVVIL